jgi:predicted phosphodiesterase
LSANPTASSHIRCGLANVVELRRWLIVAFHEPYYSTEGSYGLAGYFQQNLEPLFFKYGVDIVITGHVHAYERFFPVYQGQA